MEIARKEERIFETSNLVKMAVFAAVAGVLMFFKFPIPIAPSFMTIDFGDVATLVAGFILGPISGVITVILKNLINLLLNGTITMYVGELSNIIVGSSFVFVSSYIYHKKKTKKMAIIGLVFGVLIMTALATISNYFIIYPLYAKVMGINVNDFVGFMPPNNYINTYLDLMLYAVVPFNIVKGFLNSLVTVLIYKHISTLIKHS